VQAENSKLAEQTHALTELRSRVSEELTKSKADLAETRASLESCRSVIHASLTWQPGNLSSGGERAEAMANTLSCFDGRLPNWLL
jgi:hypothetical protein